MRIATLGFRGEALPSIGSVARLSIAARRAGEPAHAILVEGGAVGAVAPSPFAGGHGARVEVRDLFYATPARLKFMKSERAEALAIAEEVKRQAMAHADVAFSLDIDGRRALRLPAEAAGEAGRLARLAAVLGADFGDNALAIDQVRDGVRLVGHAGVPTFNRGNAQHQYLFVNGRPVRDRLLQGALRAAYADFLARDRHPVAALYLELDPTLVDVNVHPAKAEVRFRDAALVRGLIIGSLRHALAGAGHRASTTVAAEALAGFRPGASGAGFSAWSAGGWTPRPQPDALLAGVAEISARFEPVPAGDFAGFAEDGAPPAFDPIDYPLGAARAQLHETYIVAQTRDGVVIVDQHAAHERLVYERMKEGMEAGGAPRQALLMPQVVELDPAEAERVASRAGELADLGLVLEPFGPGAVLVRETPAALGDVDAGRPGARHRRRPRRERRRAGAEGAAGACRRHHGLPRLGPRRPPPHRAGDERAAAPDGGHAPLRPVQPRPPHLRGAEARRHRAPVRAALSGTTFALLAALPRESGAPGFFCKPQRLR